MKEIDKNANLYDIDGEIIQKPQTIEETKARIEYYRGKLKELPENDPKGVYYATYMRNLSSYLLSLYSKLTPEQLQAEIKETALQHTTEEQIRKAMEDLVNEEDDKDDTETAGNTTDEVSESSTTDIESTTDEKPGDDETIERNDCDVHEEGTTSQGDLLVERDINPTDLKMDEYVDYEEA